ncbi:MAG: twin-arginine translocation signal domain-containing protein [Limisphaerales bacterium]
MRIDPTFSTSLLSRRSFLQTTTLGASALAAGVPILGEESKPEYKGPNIIIIRFGGGVRRRETIDPDHTYSPFLRHELTKRGILFPRMEISSLEGIETSHGQGTLYILTGKYEKFKDVGQKFLGQRFEAQVPTVFEYLRKSYDVPEHQTLIINGEDRTDEEFYSFSNHHLFGAHFRSNVLSLYRFKSYLLRRQLDSGKWEGKELEKKRQDLSKLEALDYRTKGQDAQGAAITEFWDRWRQHYGETGLVNPRGDRLLTELTIRALKELRPKMMMVNYNDPDYVHWGYMSHYTRGISVMDEGLRQIVSTVEADAEYRDNTIFVVVPDCGRDTNPFADVPCQHHFGSRSSHEIFALIFGPGIQKGVVHDKPVDQISVAATIGKITGARSEFAEGPILSEAFA